MKKLFFVVMILSTMASLLVTAASAAPAALLTATAELGQLKVCKVAGTGVEVGNLFNFRVNGSNYSVPAGPADRNGYCVLAGQYPVNSEVTIEEVIPDGNYVARIEVRPDRTVSKDTSRGIVTVRIVGGVIEAIFTNKAGPAAPTRTPTPIETSTPRPTRTPPSCDPNCTPTSTPIPMGRLQICKEAEGPGVMGSFTFRFDTRSRTVPVGACAGLIAVEAGTLTITEDAQAGYSVADIYTIPADRLISEDPGGKATVRIVEGTAASQTIVIFRNRSVTTGTATPTSTGTPSTFTPIPTGSQTSTPIFTPTFTPTSTSTPNPSPIVYCAPPHESAVTRADFTQVRNGQSVEGMGKVAPGLNIDASNGTAVRVSEGTGPQMYLAPNEAGTINGGLAPEGGFSNPDAQAAGQPHSYTFTFAPGTSVNNFALHMLDYGDVNPSLSIDHVVAMTAYDASGQPIPGASQLLTYVTPPVAAPRESSLSGDLFYSGDAVTALPGIPGQPGNWIWHVSGNGIARVVLEFGAGYDPNIAFDRLAFSGPSSNMSFQRISADFSGHNRLDSVEGLGEVAPFLDINAKGEAVRLFEETSKIPEFEAYEAPNGSENNNRRMLQFGGGGFSDPSALATDTQPAGRAPLYTFTFTPGVSITSLALRMLDFGDWNPTRSTNHRASMTAYDANGNVVSREELSYETDPAEFPQSATKSDGSPWLIGDTSASCEVDSCGDARADVGEPGNWVWNVSGDGIVKVVLEFGAGYDPAIAFDLLSYRACEGCQLVLGNFSSVQPGQPVEGLGRVAPDLNIDANGTAVRVAELQAPVMYVSPNTQIISNSGLSPAGGFADLITQDAPPDPHRETPQFTFTFNTPENVSVVQFCLRMLDFGDWNPEKRVLQKVTLIAYDAEVGGNPIAQEELSYQLIMDTPTDGTPGIALTLDGLPLCRDMYFCGDGETGLLGEPGNWVWSVTANGIKRVELRFGVEIGDLDPVTGQPIPYGFDPNFALDSLSFVVVQK